MSTDNQQETINKVSQKELGWLAGVIDGEGTVVLFLGVRGDKLNNVSPQVVMGNTDKELFERYVDILKRLEVGVHCSHRIPNNKNGVSRKPATRDYKELHIASVAGFMRTKKLLELVGEDLTGEKKTRANLLLRFINQRLSRSTISGLSPIGRMAPFDENDLLLIKEFCKYMRSKHEPIIDGLLRDYTQGRQKAA